MFRATEACMAKKRIGFLLYPGIQALDVAGPMDAFAAAAIDDGKGGRTEGYEVVTVAMSVKPVKAESGLILKPQFNAASAPPLDTLVIPGGRTMRDPHAIAKAAAWIKQRSPKLRRIAAICTGVYGLAETGLLAGRRVTTHWRYAKDLAKRFPELSVEPDAIFVKDGSFYTSAGITAGIDLALALIEEDCGTAVSLSVARELVVYLRRSGGQAQYSEPLQFEAQTTDRMAEVAHWIATNLHRTITVDALAQRARLCPRQFARRFKHAFGVTPASFVETARLNEAQRRLAESPRSIDRVSASLGYRSAHVFRRAFERQFGISPSLYRNRFGARAASK
jgi:transcriptional regulator GlxA family with amidase domain